MEPIAWLGRTLAVGLAAVAATGAWLAAPSATAAATTTHVAQSYAIAATLDVEAARLEAVETLTITNQGLRAIDHVNLSVIARALGFLSMDAPVTVDGNPASTSWTTTTNLRVALDTPVAPGETTVLVVPFVLDVGSSPETFGARLSRDADVLSFGMWFPILSREHDVYGLGDPQMTFNADVIRLELTTLAPLPRDAVACPGLRSAPRTTGTEWVCEASNVRDLSFVVNPRFRLTTREVHDITIRVYTETTAGDVTAETAQSALLTLNQLYGNYPWPDLVLAEVGAGGGFSMEYPGSIHLTRTKVTDAYVINHEVAHQWFYAQLGNNQMREPWLDEAFADFSARYLMSIPSDSCSSRDVDSSVFAWPADATSGGDWTSCDGYFHTVFYRGTEFLNTVRAEMGDEAFFASVRDFIDRNRFGVTTTRGLLDHLDAWAPTDLRPIYRAYLATYDAPAQPTPWSPGSAKRRAPPG